MCFGGQLATGLRIRMWLNAFVRTQYSLSLWRRINKTSKIKKEKTKQKNNKQKKINVLIQIPVKAYLLHNSLFTHTVVCSAMRTVRRRRRRFGESFAALSRRTSRPLHCPRFAHVAIYPAMPMLFWPDPNTDHNTVSDGNRWNKPHSKCSLSWWRARTVTCRSFCCIYSCSTKHTHLGVI